MNWLSSLWAFLSAKPEIPLAALISLQTLQNALNTLGYPAVVLFIMIESMGVPFPGETMLLFASFYAAIDHHLQIPVVIICAALGAIIGDNLGYWIGHTGGRALVLRFGRFLFIKPQHIERAERFFEKHGNKTVFFGRFISILRTWVAFLAGVNHMPWRTFLLYNAAGGIVWAIIYGLLGYFAGRYFHDNFGQVQSIARTLSWGGALSLVALITALYVAFRLVKRRSRPQAQAAKNASPTIDPNNHQGREPLQDMNLHEAASPISDEQQDGRTGGVSQQDEIPQTDL